MIDPSQPTEAQVLEESFEDLERRVRQGLGPEEAIVDVLKDGAIISAWVRSDAARVLLRDSFKRITSQFRELTGDPSKLTPEKAFHGVLALSLEVGIVRRIAATIAAGNNAEEYLAARDRELDAESGNTDET
ncbi:MAG: hypothetical protein ACRDK7_10075 [Solirubrobacteraceae bacterium]